MSFQTSALIVSWVAILLLALVVSGLVRQVHALSTGLARRPGGVGLPPGAPAPGLARLSPGHRGYAILLFLEPGCGTCDEVLDEATRHHGDDMGVHAVYRGPAPAGLPVVAHGNQADLFTRYDAIATPFAVLVDPAGRLVRSEPVGSRAAFRSLLAAAVPAGRVSSPEIIPSSGTAPPVGAVSPVDPVDASRDTSPGGASGAGPVPVQPTRPEGM